MPATTFGGPECPKCGCNATTLLGVGNRSGRPWARFGCDHCRHEFVEGQLPPGSRGRRVEFNTTYCHCPRCRAVNPPIIRTRGRIRDHRCSNCGVEFESEERKPAE